MKNLSILSGVFAIGVTAVALAYYGRGGETHGRDGWSMLFATWRDSLIITLLFLSQGFVYRFGDFSGYLTLVEPNRSVVAGSVTPIALFLIDVLIFIAAALRIIALTRWLAARDAD